MLLSTIITTIALSVAAAAVPLTEEIEARWATEPNCKTFGTGYLSGHQGNKLKAFSKASNSQLVFTPSSYKSALKVNFQVCAPAGEEPGEMTPGSGVYWGRLYVPALKKCIHVTNQSSAKEPYYPVVTTCKLVGDNLVPYPDTFVLNRHEGNAIYWAGSSDEEGVDPQGGCGLFGYKNKNGVPVLTKSKQVILTCRKNNSGGAPFYLAPKAV